MYKKYKNKLVNKYETRQLFILFTSCDYYKFPNMDWSASIIRNIIKFIKKEKKYVYICYIYNGNIN